MVDRAMHCRSGCDQQPAPPERLLVVITQLALRELPEVVRQDAASASRAKARAGIGQASQVGMHLTGNRDADLVLMAASADDFRSDAVLRHRRHGDHFALEP